MLKAGIAEGTEGNAPTLIPRTYLTSPKSGAVVHTETYGGVHALIRDSSSVCEKTGLAIWGMVIGLTCFFAFVAVRLFILDVSSDVIIPGRTQGMEERIGMAHGVIQVNHLTYSAVFFFAGAFASLTFGFTALGIYAYHQKEP